ncbi:MAG TPA: relaxase domain-containing protein [Solirubrobacteraceae bacterium]|nr:relaxase domain-containing protein [Solirubrobacteraceae bacterium]
MLSIGKVAAGQHRYHEQQVPQGVDDYYSGRGEAPGWWAGSGADALVLDGRATGEQFNALIAADPHFLDRHRVTSQTESAGNQLARLTHERATLARELGDTEQVRSDLDGLDRAIASLAEEHRSMRGKLVERDLANPARWVSRTFGERPTNALGERWDRAVTRAVAHRLDHNITDHDTPLGPQHAANCELREWEQAQQMPEHDQLDVGRGHDHTVELENGF